MENKEHALERTTSPDLSNRFFSDASFDSIYPLSIQKLAARHWTPIEAAKKAARFLAVKEGVKILDIGSGVGKFCLSASYYEPHAFYYGIEQRESLYTIAEAARKELGFSNISFLHGNFTQFELTSYDHFYFYNAFYENLSGTSPIDQSIEYSEELYFYYTRYLFKQLEKMPSGTRLVTFYSLESEIPPGFMVVGGAPDEPMKFWIKL